jgi:[ribosomal protein S5]-alanine N-acetyltransferase
MRRAGPLRGARLTLRPLTAGDADGPYLGWMSNPNVLRHLEARHIRHDRASLRAFIETSNADPSTLLLGLVVTADDRHIGNIKLGPIDLRHRRGDVGILIGDTAMWGRGYAAEAISILAAHAFGELRLHRLTAGFYASNAGSIRAFEKAGFHVEARLPEHWQRDGAWEDGFLMARLAPAGLA